MKRGVAFSNLTPPSEPPHPGPESPLNALAGTAFEKGFRIVADKAAASVDFSSIADVVLGVEYTAELA